MTYTVRFGYDVIEPDPSNPEDRVLTTIMDKEQPDRTFPSFEAATTYGQEIRRATGLLHLRYMVFASQ